MNGSSAWTLGWRTLWRDLRAGELRLLIVAVMLAVAALSSVGFFADRLQAGRPRDARQLLGGDMGAGGDNPNAPAFSQRARGARLQALEAISFPPLARPRDPPR